MRQNNSAGKRLGILAPGISAAAIGVAATGGRHRRGHSPVGRQAWPQNAVVGAAPVPREDAVTVVPAPQEDAVTAAPGEWDE